MKKFNEFEKGMIVDALNYYVANLESEIEKMQNRERRSIIAPGFYEMQKQDLITKVESLTKKTEQ